MLAAVAIMNNIPAILAVFLFEIIFPLPRSFEGAIAPDKGLGRFSALGITGFARVEWALPAFRTRRIG